MAPVAFSTDSMKLLSRSDRGSRIGDRAVEAPLTLAILHLKCKITRIEDRGNCGQRRYGNAFHTYFGTRAMNGYVVHLGDVRLPLGGRVTALPFAEL
jgi:hypothetical protein